TPVTPENVLAIQGPPRDGAVLGVPRGGGNLAWYPLAGGEPRVLSVGLPPGTWPLRVSADPRSLFLAEDGVPGHIDRLDLATGRRTPWKTLLPEDPAGVAENWAPWVTPDGRAYAYCYLRFFQDLYLVDDVR